MAKKKGIKIIAENRRARREYNILEKLEAGLVLAGTEVKSLRTGRANLAQSYVRVVDGEAYIVGFHISPYEHGNRYNLDPLRDRKLLLHKREISRLYQQVTQEGLTIIPLSIYFRDGLAKLEIALARGKKLYDHREDEAKRAAEREMARRRDQ
ncbi:MAG: SsrA-binding protein SmpB [Clostridiaceae bacterium]|nr:SsrA-binding protein SmpB [Clostridiaceae bacterium]